MHTQGPWEARDVSQPCIEILGNEDSEGTKDIVAAVLGGKNPYHRTEEQWANARLIAASPDLLAACESVLEWASTPGNHGGFNPYGLAFVQKATEAIQITCSHPDRGQFTIIMEITRDIMMDISKRISKRERILSISANL